MQLKEALSIFEKVLPEIKNALAINIKHDLDTLPERPIERDDWFYWVWDGVRALQIKEITEQRLSTIRRIDSYLAYKNSPPAQGGITEEDKQRAKEFPIAELYDGKLLSRGTQGLCPFHEEKTPSFHINKKKNTWKCFGCDTYGDSIDFVMKRDGLDFINAVKLITKQV